MTTALNRRTLLRGAGGLAFGLPFLEAMRQGGLARAATAEAPKRVVVWYNGVGTVLAKWRPTGTGTNYVTSEILAPLDTPSLRRRLAILSGMRSGAAQKSAGNAHAAGMAALLTGRPFTERVSSQFGDKGWGGGISIDQLLAKRLAAKGQLPSIEAGIITRSSGPSAYMSYSGPGQVATALACDATPWLPCSGRGANPHSTSRTSCPAHLGASWLARATSTSASCSTTNPIPTTTSCHTFCLPRHLSPGAPWGHGAMVWVGDALEPTNWYEVGFESSSYFGMWIRGEGWVEDYMRSEELIPGDRWLCVEFMFDGATPSLGRYWADGSEIHIDPKRIAGTDPIQSSAGASVLKAQQFKTFKFGIEFFHGTSLVTCPEYPPWLCPSYNNDEPPYLTDAWIDDVALDTKRVGCL